MKHTFFPFIFISFLVPLFTFTSCLNEGALYSEDDDTSIEESIVIESTNVMLQGFTWSSNSNSRTGYKKDWFTVEKENADQIKGTFEYVWFPPVSDSLSDNGYLPRELNNLTSKYGNSSTLQASINAISPAKAIGDIVINHRVGSTSWGDFKNPSFGTVKGSNYKAICSNDEGFASDPYMSKVPSSMRGNADTGDSYGSGRDLDHTNTTVQNEIVTWMNNVLKDAGFVGWRYDYVRGYAGKYTGYYNAKTDAEFSVGEMWPDSFSTSSTNWTDKMTSWVSSTTESVYDDVPGKKSRVFDFVLKGMMNSVFGTSTYSQNNNYNLLASPNTIFAASAEDAVTFVDNHDTGSTQALWPLDSADLGLAYALILTHPGYPCVAWQHYFASSESDDASTKNKSQYLGGKIVPGTERTYKNHIRYLISLRSSLGINETSTREVLSANAGQYAAKVTGEKGSLILSLGQKYQTPEGYTLSYSGTGFEIFTEN